MTTALFRILNITTADYNNHLFKQAREGFRPISVIKIFLGILKTIFGESLGILWQLWGKFFGNSIGILW